MGDDGKPPGGEKKSKISNSSSPYYLHPSDTPGANICGVVLKGDVNYREWATSIRNAFWAKRKLGFIDGSITKPDEGSEDLEDWNMVNSMLVGWLMISTEPSVRTTVGYADNAKDLWEDLKVCFSVADAVRIHQLRESIKDCRQTGSSVTSYFGRLRLLWDELDGLVSIPTCRCNKCSCELAKEFATERESEKLHQFLMGLDATSYRTVRSNILSTTPLPSLSRAYAMIIQEERHKELIRTSDERGDAVGFAVQAQNHPVTSQQSRNDASNMGTRGPHPVCTHFNKVGHEAKNYFDIVGFPDWWFNGPAVRGGNLSHGSSSRGRGRGRGSARSQVANVAVAQNTIGTNASPGVAAAVNDSDRSAFPSLTPDQ